MDHNGWTQVVGLSGSFGLGMCFALLGSIAVKMMPRMGIDQAKFGSMISAFMFACLLASLAVGVMMDSLGYKTVAIIGFAAAATSILMLANAKSFQAGLIACILLGVGAMACNTTGNVLGTQVVQDLFKGNAAAANNIVNVFFGLGLFLTPFVVSFLFQKVSYEKAVSALGVIVLLPLVFALLAKYPAAPAGFTLGDAFGLLKEPVTILAALVLFCYIALESSFCNWLAPFGKEVLSKEKPDMPTDKVDASAARLLSVFAVAMMVGRLVTGLTTITQLGGWLIAGAAVVAAVIIIVMLGVKSSCAAYAMAAFAGLVFAPAFPTTVGVTFTKFGGGSGSLFGIIFAVGLAGAVIVPKAIGNMAKGASVQKALKLLLPACVILAVLAVGLHYVKAPAAKVAAPAAPAMEAPATPVPAAVAPQAPAGK
ncbi:MAG: MFS transporter [Verrucomicrobia bacterium]|nr:MAG: MFS transporter [Verrucomicrobiota bacterium]